MDFKLNDEQLEFQEHCRRFAREVIRPAAPLHDREESVPWEVIKAAREWGLHGLETIQKMGSDPDGLFSCIYAEELHWGCAGIALAIQGGSLAAAGIASSGTPEQIGRWVPECFGTGDEIKLGAYAVTEPSAGSDVRSLRTTAKLDGDEWVINGSKAFITNSGTDITSVVTITALTGDRGADGHREISAIMVPAGTPGFRVSQKYSKVGWNASDTRELFFDDVRVPAANLVGERGRGYAQFLSILDEGRVAIAALATGLAQGCVDESVRYAHDRRAFGHSIGSYQAIQFMIADMEVRASTARLAYYRAAEKMLRGEPFKREASIAKLYSSEIAMDNARYATQVHGGYGFMNEYPVARHYRDSKILEIGEGTTEVQLMLIARELGL